MATFTGVRRDEQATGGAISAQALTTQSTHRLSAVRGFPGLASVPLARRAPFFPLMMLVFAAACSVSVGCVMLLAQQGSASATELALMDWRRACLASSDPGEEVEDIASTISPPGVAPGLGRYLAQAQLTTYGKLTVADILPVFGEPLRAGCLEYGLLLPDHKAVKWERLVFADGRIEAFALIQYHEVRLAPDMPVHTLRCYAADEDYSLRNMVLWDGFGTIAGLQDCPQRGTAVPP